MIFLFLRQERMRIQPPHSAAKKVLPKQRGNTVQESFGQAFSKACALKPRRLVAVRRRRNSPNGVSLLLSFSLCAFCAKEKSGKHVLCYYAATIFSPVGERLAAPDVVTQFSPQRKSPTAKPSGSGYFTFYFYSFCCLFYSFSFSFARV